MRSQKVAPNGLRAHEGAGGKVKIWVVLPTYNGEQHLGEQLESIATQSRLPDGLVASDDASTDSTSRLLEDFQLHAPFRVTLLRQDQNVGLLTNLEMALAAVPHDAAEIIVFADQDDVWAPEKLQLIEDAFADPRTLLWFSDAHFVDGQGEPYGLRLWQALGLDEATQINDSVHLGRFIEGKTITGTAMAARRSLVDAASPFPRTRETTGHNLFLHDGWLGLLAHLRGGIVLEPRVLTAYRQHASQYTGMSLLHAARAEPGHQQRNLGQEQLRKDAQRIRAVTEHLLRPHTLDYLGREIPPILSRRERYLTMRSDVLDGKRGVTQLLKLWRDGDYNFFAHGLRTLAADAARYMTRSGGNPRSQS